LLEVVAFEGNPKPPDGITWGAAAIQVGQQTLNAVTRLAVSPSELERLASDGTLIRLPKPMPIPPDCASSPIVVAKTSKHGPFSHAIGELRHGSIGELASKDAVYYAYTGLTTFRDSTARAITKLLQILVYEKWSDDSATVLIRTALTLDSTHPELNAIWAYRNRSKSFVKQVARRNVGNAKERLDTFETLYANLCATELPELELEYRGGMAEEGKLTLPMSSAILSSFQNVYSSIALETQRLFAFLRDIKPPTLHEWRPASVHWSFQLAEPDEPFGDKLARVIVSNRIRECLSTGSWAHRHEAIRRAYETLIHPAMGTQFAIRIGQDRSEIDAPPTRESSLRWAKRLSESDAQIVGTGWPVPYLRLTRSDNAIDHKTWFRDQLFGNQNWHAGEWNGKPVEETETSFSIAIDGLFLGQIELRITHSVERSQSGHSTPPTWIHWNDHLLSAFQSGFYAYRWIWIERIEDKLYMTIDALPPPWLR
jgi:hypothetical protein